MMLVASIKCGPAVTMDWWERYVLDHESLEVPAAREEANPFDGTPTTLRPEPGTCNVIVDGEVAGSIAPSNEFDEARMLFVHASDPDEHWIEELVEAVSEDVDGSTEWLE